MNTIPNLSLAAILLCAAWPAHASERDDNIQAAEVELLSAGEMDVLAGGTGVEVEVVTDQVLTATNSGNTVTGDVIGSGEITLGSDAFSGYSGIGNFVINTGHNNNLQSSVNVSIVLPPAAPGP